MEDLFIDVGFDSEDEAAKAVRVGDLVTLKRDVVDLQALSWPASPSTTGRV
jgi:putative aminopeptidase FrvX